jgi:RHH-type proline utilization regulon transcriptional repressor/proline dehydrogenase/delta 1-pyrroline-5-carboxylate dehydrogenase
MTSLQMTDSVEFKNCPMLDFGDAAVRKRFSNTLDDVRSRFPIAVPVMVGGMDVPEKKTLKRPCPSDIAFTVADVSLATPQCVEKAMRAAYAAWPIVRDMPLLQRVQLLQKLAERLEHDRYELACLMTYEVGKTWTEADADVAEAIDFCRYYAAQALTELRPQRMGHVLGEHNVLSFEGRGPTVVIAPWNFPLAILCGMTVGAFVAGNSVIMKPAEQSCATAFALYECMMAAGFPKDAVHFLPGIGEDIGPALVEHSLTAQVVFTGSRAVGQSIAQSAAKPAAGQKQMKRVVCEMGGKNAIVIDEDADLDEAVAGVVKSAFGYAGQKCSACSRIFVVGEVYSQFIERLVGATKSLHIGPAYNPSCGLGPVVDLEAKTRLEKAIEEARQTEKTLYVAELSDGAMRNDGYYVGPAIFETKNPRSPLMQNELFGPVVGVMAVQSFDEALALAVDVDYALTGAVFSRTPSHIEKARKEFRVGNLYLNRGSTGAMVYRQPFGGFKMSGYGHKAGGPGYLLNFVDQRTVTEHTMRRGFTPDLTE